MRIRTQFLLHLFVIGFIAYGTPCAASPSPFSNHGNIQNVQNYSSNPFWSPNAPYNQRMPTPVYVDGPDVKSGECNQLLAQLVAQQCGMRNNCRDTKLSDIRPAIMMQLTSMPGANYGTSCAGYLDGAFNDYVKQHTGFDKNAQIAMPILPPTPTITNQPTNAILSTLPTSAPKESWRDEMAARKAELAARRGDTPPTPGASKESWRDEVAARKAELAALREASGANEIKQYPAEMPKVAADFSFEERKANLKEGYEPYAGVSAFKKIEIESMEDYLDRRIRIAAKRREWCEAKYGTTTQTLREDLAKIKACRAAGTPIAECQTTGSY